MKNLNSKNPCVVLTGPTAVGKTELSLALAKELRAEIISADSMQVYRNMNIGTAKIRPEEMQGIPHHFIDILDPSEECSAFFFQQYAKQTIQKIYKRGRIPLIVGGTGFYIQTVLYDVHFEEEKDTEQELLLHKLEALAEEEGGKTRLHESLSFVDPAYAAEVHENNVKKVIRALCFYEQTGIPLSEHNKAERRKESPYNQAYFVLTMDRQKLYQRIDARIDLMIQNGLLDEVRGFYEQGFQEHWVSMSGLGYKEFFPWLRGEISLEEAIGNVKRDTRHFAKRQLTWFKRERDVIWVNKDDFNSEEEILRFMLTILKERDIL